MTDTERVLEALRNSDRRAAQNVEGAIQWLVGDEHDLQSVSQSELQRFLWYSLPMKWMVDAYEHRAVARSLGHVFREIGLERYAEICTSALTDEILGAYAESSAAGKRVAKAAHDKSGLTPPDFDDFQWGIYLSPAENRAEHVVSDLLELSIMSGELSPGTRGWKAQQQAITSAAMRASRLELGGRSFLEAVRQERLANWVKEQRSATMRAMVAEILPGIERDPEPGPPFLVEPMRWFLERMQPGQRLTARGNLNRDFVHEASTMFGWWDVRWSRQPNSEERFRTLFDVRSCAKRMGLIRTTKGVLTLTTLGKAAVTDPYVLWTALVRNLFEESALDHAIGSAVLATLLTNDLLTSQTLKAVVIKVLHEQGWSDRTSGREIWPSEADPLTMNVTRLLVALHLVDAEGGLFERKYRMNVAGRRLSVDVLRQVAIGPRNRF